MKIYKIAAPKDKILQYKIQDPALQFLVYQNENLFPWDQITPAKVYKKQGEEPKCEQEINLFVHNTLLPQLYQKINPESETPEETFYLKDIDLEKEFQQNPDDPQVQQAYALYKQDPEGAKAKILEGVNEEKQNSFFDWWNYIIEQYKESPAFAYTMLNPVIHTSPDDTHTPAIPIDANAVAKIYEKIVDGTKSMNVLKDFQAEVNKSSQMVSGTFENGWVLVPSEEKCQSDPDKYGTFEENLKRLRMYGQPAGWCVGQDTWSRRYLAGGDFYIYVGSGKPKVAIRLTGPRKVAEIRGTQNDFDNLAPYWEITMDFLQKSDLDYKDNEQFKRLHEVAVLNKNLDNPENRKNLLEAMKETPTIYNKLSRKNRMIPEIQEAAYNIWWKEIEESPHKYNDMPEDLRVMIPPEEKQKMANAWSDKIDSDISQGATDGRYVHMSYENCPEDLKPLLRPESIEVLKKAWYDKIEAIALPQGVTYLRQWSNNCPKEFLESPEIKEEIKKKWMELTQKEPWRINDCPGFIVQDLPEKYVEELKRNTISQLVLKLETINENNPKGYNPEEIVDDYQEIFVDEYIDPTIYGEDGFDEDGFDADGYDRDGNYDEDHDRSKVKNAKQLREIDSVRNAIKEAWVDYISADVDRAEELDGVDNDYYREHQDEHPKYNDYVYEAISNAWDHRIAEDPRNLDNAPEYIYERYTYDGDEDGYLTRIWKDFLEGNPDELDDAPEFVVKNMEPEFLGDILLQQGPMEDLPSNVIIALDDMNPRQLYQVFQTLPENVVQDYMEGTEGLAEQVEQGRVREKELSGLEQGQQEFEFSRDYPSQIASNLSWYKQAQIAQGMAEVIKKWNSRNWYEKSS